MFENLATIANIKSRVREDFETFLREHRKELNKLEWIFDGKNLEVDALHIEQNVVTERIKERKKDSRSGATDSDDERTVASALEVTGQAALQELATNISEREQVRWSSVTRKNDLRLVIIGAPGSGKSFGTRFLVIEKIDEALNLSDKRSCRLESIELPLWLTASEMAAQNTDQPESAIAEIVRSRFHKFRLSERFYKLFEQKLDDIFGQASSDDYFSRHKILFLVVDSLDELADIQKNNFRNVSRNLDKPSLRLILTCRTLHWEKRRGWLGFTPKEKVEIAPLNFPQQKQFAAKFFTHRPDLLGRMRNLLEGNPALRYALTTPLLLTFGCLLHGDSQLTKTISYVQIYALVIRKMFTGDWRDDAQKPYWAKDEIKTEFHLILLDKICWEIFNRNPELNLFTLDLWTEVFEQANPVKSEDYDKFLRELEKLGFVVKAGFDNGMRQWSFAHRTFLEFMAARALSRREDWLKIASQHFWFAPEWLECLTFLAGLAKIENARKLLLAVRREEDDIFGSMMFLEAKLVGASALTEEPDIISICGRILVGVAETTYGIPSVKPKLRRYITGNQTIYLKLLRPAFSALRNNLAAEQYIVQNFIPSFIDVIRYDADNYESACAVIALGELGIVSEEIITTLIDLVKPDAENCWCAAEALGKLGIASEEVITALVKFLNSNASLSATKASGKFGNAPEEITIALFKVLDFTLSPAELWDKLGTASEGVMFWLKFFSSNASRSVVEALGKLGTGSEEVITALVELIKSDGIDFYGADVARALNNLGASPEAVITFLLKSVKFAADEDERAKIVFALGQLGNVSEEVVTALIEVVKYDTDDYVRVRAVFALYNLGIASDKFVIALIELVKLSFDDYARINAAEVLCRLNRGSEEVITFLVEFLNSDSEYNLLVDAFVMLGELGITSEEVITALVKFLNSDASPYQRVRAAEALGKLGITSNNVVVALVKIINSDTEDYVRDYAAAMLGKFSTASEEVVTFLVEFIKSDVSGYTRHVAKVLGEAYLKRQLGETFNLKIRETFLQNLSKDSYALNSDFATPLFQISSAEKRKFLKD